MKWLESTLGEICDVGGGEIKTGPFGSQLHQSDYDADGTPVVMPKDIIDGRVLEGSIARVNGGHVERLARHKLNKGDIVYGRRGDIGRQALVRKENIGWLCGTGCLRVTVGERSPVSSHFLHLYLKQPDVITWISNQAIGATMPNLNTSILRSVPVRYPEKFEYQDDLADKLTAYDNLIENNNRRIVILEEMAQSLYREWFVKFRFPGHEGCQFKDSPLGQIPAGWAVKHLEEVFETIIDYRGKTPKKLGGDWIDSGIKALSALNVKNGGLIRLEACKQVGVDIFEKWMKVKLQKNDILLTSEAPLGEVALLKGETEYCLSQRLFALRANIDLVSPEYIFLALFSGHLLGQLTSRATGATVAGIRQALLKEVPIVVPPKDVIDQFTQIADLLLSEKNVLWRKNNNLKEQRDMLLPKLISGQIVIEG